MTPTTEVVAALRAAIATAWRGPPQIVDLVLAAVASGGHLLLQDVPGVGKTTLASALAHALGGRFARLQLTADLLPGDLTGVNVLVPGAVEPAFRPGPIFANVVLADEINRTTPRTQSALLEAMSEGRVSLDGTTRELPRPFLVIATQNPYEQHGTFPLPDSQLDRFLMRVSLGYPRREQELAILRQAGGRVPMPAPVTTPEAVAALATQVESIHISPEVEDHLLDLVWLTRAEGRLLRGASPRGAQALHRAARALALVRGRAFVLPEDVRELAVPVLGHRVVARTSADGGAAIVAELVRDLPPPR